MEINDQHNGGAWNKIEQDTRHYVKRAKGDVFVITGPVFTDGRADVTESDTKAAYASSGYLAHRTDVEALWRHSVGGKDIDPDLLKPLRVEDLAGNVVVAEHNRQFQPARQRTACRKHANP
ncbi:hypothetical protein CBY09_21590 [Acidovorax kalamii]|uniref:DNA/RNA non-specific endonuclease/pyrophosphatase/phosphodiesterase domain-containing protein n=1 Tax=Acidovorax kalamii TaxID=2004485 RepID=A0A235EGG9_9BURK|nr:hypothetical protein CBY09_21590 [Acidovorax kalamii]